MKNFQNFELNSSETLNVIGGNNGKGKGAGKPDFAGQGKPDFAGAGRPDFAGTGKGRRGLGNGNGKAVDLVDVIDVIAE